jgi:hypothetical protein
MKVYIYISETVIASVEDNGYMSARKLYEILGIEDEKYRKRRIHYEQTYGFNYDGANDIEKDLNFQDKSHYKRFGMKNASDANYALFYPIPNVPEILEFMKKNRPGVICDDMPLFEYELPKDTINWQLETKKYGPVIEEDAQNREKWIELWKKEIKNTKSGQCWFENIPHLAFHVGGIIAWKDLKRVNLQNF